MFNKVLVANRGEIAVRIIRACRELDLATLAIYSDADRDALHVALADRAVRIGPTPPVQSYLNGERIIAVARDERCDAIHPGYGFLAENATFARACQEAQIAFIGPSPHAMEQMGDKLAARVTAQRAGVPIVPGTLAPVRGAEQVREFAQAYGYPVAVKASAGGGGKGLKVAHSAAEIETAVSLASKEAGAYFADDTLYLERYLANPKHVEVQILGDRHGHVVHVGERDCSLQRRHQKLVEETPAQVPDALRARMHESAVALARLIGYDSAGTIECLVEGDEFFFLEMNTRIQVEHTISEATYGFDLVKAQIRIAAGEPLWFGQADLVPRGHAIECRINAESAARGFSPAPGRIARYVEPSGPGIRVDGAAFAGCQIGSDYDSLVAKLVAWGADREEARFRMRRALAEYVVEGVETTIPFYRLLLDQPAFISGQYTTSTVDAFVREHATAIARAYEHAADQLALHAEPQARSNEASDEVTVEVNDKRFRVRVFGWSPSASGAARTAPKYKARNDIARAGSTVLAPMHGIVAEIRVRPGDVVTDGQVVAVIEAMKMMNEVIIQRSGTVASLGAKPGDTIEANAPLLSLEETGD